MSSSSARLATSAPSRRFVSERRSLSSSAYARRYSRHRRLNYSRSVETASEETALRGPFHISSQKHGACYERR
jgi:hypothetical protein